MRERFLVVEDRVETIWKNRLAPGFSPRQLNDLGKEILNKSGIKEIVEEKKSILTELVKKKNPSNAYDAEKAISEIMSELPRHCPDVIEKLKQGAFESGVEISEILLVGSIHFRNLIFPELGFKLEELD